ncbi:uncharacterized protein OCT59_010051 [Rhizophagus irregularis]|nr:hypothetical protein OCT59_010051 [Rhizophagus irregularis]GBC38895.2 hypothetical protein GLOIN_2v1869445 [Rhizophagus irregularis DAOM 181602=DAOM 197198]
MPSSSPNTPSRRQPSRIPRSPNRSRITTPSISRPLSSGSRPVTPSFFQSAETINIYINYNEPDRDRSKCCLKRILMSPVISKIPDKLELPEEELGDELVEESHELVSDSLVELASDSLDTLCWSKSDL